jgi:thymidylate kinase
VPSHVRLAEHVWITAAAATNAAKLWRAVLRSPRVRVLVLDRFTLDADVKLTFWSARRDADVAVERRLFRAVAPRPDVAVLLAVRPETNHQRRADEGTLERFRDYEGIYARTARELDVEVVDGERPVAEVARDVARLVWRRLP